VSTLLADFQSDLMGQIHPPLNQQVKTFQKRYVLRDGRLASRGMVCGTGVKPLSVCPVVVVWMWIGEPKGFRRDPTVKR
jgi:hypothetical protein